jgi:hypothetical protein
MKRFFLLAISLILFEFSYSQGLIFDSTSFNQQKEFPVERAVLPYKASLEMYLPALYPQTGGTCVAMATALARTIMYAKSLGTTDVNFITRNQMSPYFLYYYARDENDYSCEKGLNPIAAFNVAQKIGFEKLFKIEFPNYWPFKKSFLCPREYNFLPPETKSHLDNAKVFRISDFFVTKTASGIKSALAKGTPVVLAMLIPKSFELFKGSFWKAQSYESRINASGHAMVAIGYDDYLNGGSIRIANSWGTEWGDKGKVWINYKELERWLDGAFIMIAASATYGLGNEEFVNNYKLPKEKTFKVSEFNGKFNFNNKEYLKIFSNTKK